MNPKSSSCRTLAFTLVEMLVVIAIIAILAALLMPVLNKAEQRAKRIVCVDDLGQVGLAFHTFSNDHNGKFPMAISTNDGGSLEYVESGFAAGSLFYTAFRNFQPLSPELVNPQLLICPADVRTATNFESMQNYSLSYFVGVEATFDKPGSILAGDQNLVTNGDVVPFIMPFPGPELSWAWNMHQFKGNVVFADGHVEQWNNSSLAAGEGESPFNQSLFMPICPGIPGNFGPGDPGPGPVSSGPSPSSGPGPAPSSPSEPMQPSSSSAPGASAASSPSQDSSPPTGQLMPSPSGSSGQQLSQSETVSQSQAPDRNLTAPGNPPISTDTDAVVSVQDPNSGMSDFDRHMTMVMQGSLIWLYILLCILVLLYVLYRVVKRKYEKWARQSENERRL